MDNTTAIILGLIQGLTEFLPVSSSAHLVFAEKILGTKASAAITFEVMLHLGTLVAVLIYFRSKIWQMINGLFPPYNPEKRPFLKNVYIIVLATIPAAVLGLLFKDTVEAAFNSAVLSGALLVVTGLVLLSTHYIKRGVQAINVKNGFVIGLAQALALLPGISRSGMTISAGLFQKINPAEAAEFSFLLSLPSVLGAVLLKSITLLKTGLDLAEIDHYIIGTLVSFIVGYASIAWLMRLVKKGQFFYFGIYCVLVGILAVIFL
jgi:undecaprenyl-diphosphatase